MKDNKLKRTIVIWLAIIIVVAAASTILSSCNPEKKIQKAVTTLKKTGRLNDVCAENYPPKEVYIKGDTVYNYDTLWGEGSFRIDTFMVNDTIFIQKTSKPITIVKTKLIVDTVVKRDLAFESVLKEKMDSLSRSNYILVEDNSKLRSQVDEWKGKAKQRWWFMWIILAVCGLITFRKPIFKLLKLTK
jgi:hypothetical protein